MTTIGAATLINQWGRDMTYQRAGVTLFLFRGRRAELRPEEQALVNSVDQHQFIIIAKASDFENAGIRPQKFDVVIDEYGDRYTVQRGRFAGADVNELVKLHVQGGEV